ncbi:MAG TPA: hemerythrin domain-containing protein [Methanomassiliicoccales archaeon]|nr:hemerythrin domain-containing protein [Methanomassiliicoccales archaeon]
MPLGWSIKEDHDYYRVHFDKMLKTSDDQVALREKLFMEYVKRLYPHHEAEELILFPAMIRKKRQEWTDLALELEMEHRAMKMLIKELREMGYGSKVWKYRLAPLLAILRIHWDKEEQFLIPFALEYFSADEWEQLGKEFDAELARQRAKPME